jgi:hypothetical protein
MGLYEKYLDSLRLDHPDVADVRKTTFAKGVITDFQTISDDPLEVESMVKVKIGEEGDESEFIPLFYHPKEGYWEDPDAEEGVDSVREFDEEKGCFKKAWMSFRCDDEVVVMLNEGAPVAVVGHADGVPRIGEDIVKIKAPDSQGVVRYFHLQCSRFKVNPVEAEDPEDAGLYGGINEEKKGPDGFELGLVLETESGPENYYQRPPSALYPDSSGDARNYGLLTAYYQPQPGGSNLARTVANIRQQYLEFMFVVGPILYIFQVLANNSTILFRNFDLGYGNDPPWHYEPLGGNSINADRIVSGGDCPESPGPDDIAQGSIPNFWTVTDIQCRAAVYSKELLDAIKEAGPASAQQAYTDYVAHGWNYEWGTKYANTVWQRLWDTIDLLRNIFSYSTWPKWDDTIFIVRPHTKEELQAAGMWPTGKGE